MIRRQHECLTVTVELAAHAQGFAAAALLRPACEELIWAKYFALIRTTDAEHLLGLIARLEILASLRAQNDYAGRQVMKSLQLSSHLLKFEAASPHLKAALRKVGQKLKWSKRAVDTGRLPSMAELATIVGERKRYKYLYHASSRFVHFSPSELLRRAWGKPGDVTITSSHFADYWAAFALHWGAQLLVETILAVAETSRESVWTEESFDADRITRAAERLGSIGQIPIITAEELDWPEQDA
jgi:hypothetical protein